MSDKMREEFEEAVATGAICDGFRHGMCRYIAFMESIKDMRTKFGYTEQVIDEAYKIWKASRAALVVDLPSMTNNGYEGFYRESEVKEVMREAGVSYK